MKAAHTSRRKWGARIASLALATGLAVLGLVTVAAPSATAAGLTSSISAWGSAEFDATAVPPGLTDVTAISAGVWDGLALRQDGTVAAWGFNGNGQTNVPAGLSGVVAVSAGPDHSMALKSDGTVVAWGEIWDGENNVPATVPAGLSGVTAIDTGGAHTLALKANGAVVAWGFNGTGQTSVPKGLSGVVAVAAGSDHSLALKSNGTVVGWGYDGSGQASVPKGLSGVVAIAAGTSHSVALKSNGTVVAWGDNSTGQTDVPAGLSGVVAISAGDAFTLALKQDGTVVGWGDNSEHQLNVPEGLSNVVAIAAGFNHSLALTQSGSVVGSTPTVSDTTPHVGQVLTARAGEWGPVVRGTPVAFSYQWHRVDANGKTTAIYGANTKNYKVANVDAGYQLKVAVTGSQPGFTSTTKTSAATDVVTGGVLEPAQPTLDNTAPTVGQTVTVVPGEWGPYPVTLSYQWYRSRSGHLTRIAGATSSTYAVQGIDAGAKLKVLVTGTKPGYTASSMASAPTAKVAKAVFSAAAAPSVSVQGTPRNGKTLTVDAGAWDQGVALSVQWYRGSSRISKATKATYELTRSDIGKVITAKVTASRTGYVSLTQVTAPTATVQPGLASPTTPSLSNTSPTAGDRVEVTNTVCPARAATGQEVTPTYQWFQKSAPIQGANDSSFAARPEDAGKRLTLVVTCHAADYASVDKASAPTAKVLAGQPA